MSVSVRCATRWVFPSLGLTLLLHIVIRGLNMMLKLTLRYRNRSMNAKCDTGYKRYCMCSLHISDGNFELCLAREVNEVPVELFNVALEKL